MGALVEMPLPREALVLCIWQGRVVSSHDPSNCLDVYMGVGTPRKCPYSPITVSFFPEILLISVSMLPETLEFLFTDLSMLL